MNSIRKRILPLLLSICLLLAVCACTEQQPGSDSSQDDVSSGEGNTSLSFDGTVDTTQTINQNAMSDNIKNAVFPMFSNDVNYSRGGMSANVEKYQDYKAIVKERHNFSDLYDHECEVAAVRLAELGVFPKTDTFSPESSMTVAGFLRAFLMTCQQPITGATSDEELKRFIASTNLIESGVSLDYSAVLTNEMLAYFLSRANEALDNTQQYEMLLSDYSEIGTSYRKAVLQTVAAGLIEVKDFRFRPKAAATRSDIACGLYRLINTGARVIPLYDLGGLYNGTSNVYLTKTSYETNERGIQLGFFTNYNHQADAFVNFGKMPIDRTGFYKWAQVEKSQGIYSFPIFSNDQSSHMLGNTIINCIDISANLVWNPSFGASNIPSFYPQDIANKTTRTAAKRFLYAFVQEMMNQVEGDIILAIDYEMDWQQALYDSAAGINRAKIFSEWYVEACNVAREAAKAAGAGSSLKLIAIFNNITNLHLKGPSANQWMLDIANAVDIVGIDSYNFYDDRTDPSYTIQNARFLMNNYSLGKPVMMVENGAKMARDFSTIDPITGLNQLQRAAAYYKNLFREFKFALERGDFLNANLSAFLVWSYFDTSATSEEVMGVVNDDNTLRENGITLRDGYHALYKQRQFNPSYAVSVSEASITPPQIQVSSGTQYDKLQYIVTDYQTATGTGKLSVKLAQQGTVFITVNGTVNIASSIMGDVHSFDLTGLRNGLNVIDIYFGARKTPFTQTVEKVLFQ